MDLAPTGLLSLEDEIPLPQFPEVQNQSVRDPYLREIVADRDVEGTEAREERVHFEYYFLAMIVLRRLTRRASEIEAVDDYGGPPIPVIREMVRQLDTWRASLPPSLRWNDEDRSGFSDADLMRQQAQVTHPGRNPGKSPAGSTPQMELATAQLRTRFYHAQFIVYRPFFWKVLHHPEAVTQDDRECCAMAIKSATYWPVALPPPKDKKRLLPHIFAWTQNFMGILFLFKLCFVNPYLQGIIDQSEVVGREDVERTAELLLEWMHDVKQVDAVAEWAWGILAPLYGYPSAEQDV